MKNSKVSSILVSIGFYIVAIIVAFFTFKLLGSAHWLIRLLIADIAATIFIFLGSFLMNNSSLYDPYWSIKPMVIAWLYMLHITFPLANTVEWLTFILMQLYGIRLTSNFYRDWVGFTHEDWRYVNLREQFKKKYWLISLLGIHLFPTILVYLGCLPMYPIFLSESGATLNFLIVFGSIVVLSSIVLAFIADGQMRLFRKKTINKGKLMNEKLWKYSRHPNYLGEISTWWGLWLIALGVNPSFWWTFIGALAINLLFVFISIPLMDKRSLEKRKEFEAYYKSSNKLLPIKI